MIRYRYNPQFSPPAAFVHVTLQSPEGEVTLPDVPAQIDTGADMIVLPANLVHQLRLVQLGAIPVVAFGSIRRTISTFLVRRTLRGQGPVAIEILSSAEEPHVLLGRDLVNRYRVVLDGPRGVLEID